MKHGSVLQPSWLFIGWTKRPKRDFDSAAELQHPLLSEKQKKKSEKTCDNELMADF